MSRIVVVHAFRAGTGKSYVTANLATVVGLRGQRVGVVDTAYDATTEAVRRAGGRVFHIPSTVQVSEIAELLRNARNVELLNDGFRKVIQALNLDVLFVDTSPGLDEETLRPIAISDVLIVVLRPEDEDFQGTSVIVEVACKLDVPRVGLVVNRVPATFDLDAVRGQVAATYQCPVAAVLPLSEETLRPDNTEVLYLRDARHPFSQAIEGLADFVMAGS